MNKRLDDLVRRCCDMELSQCREDLGGLSTGERCYVALSVGEYSLLGEPSDPIEAWHRLGPDWQMAVCGWRGWPVEWVQAREVGDG